MQRRKNLTLQGKRPNTGFLLALLILSLSISNCKKPGSDATGNNNTTYRVTVNTAPGGSGTISPSSDSVYNEGEEISLMATADSEYLFENWSDDLNSTNNPYQLTVDKNYNLTANFTLKEYELAVSTTGEGTVSEQVVQEKKTDYEHGTVVELTATPGEGYRFIEWQEDVTGSENPVQITVDSPKEVIAVFEKKSYELTVITSGEGAVSEEIVQAKTNEYEHGTIVQLTPNPAEGWEFIEWQGDLDGNETPVNIEVDSEKTVTAVFSKKPVASVEIQEENTTLRVGNELQLNAVLRDAEYNRLLDRVIEWTSLNPENATVDDAGLVTAVSTGMVTITASSEGQEDEISILVEEADASLYLQALAELQESVLKAVEHSGMWWTYSVDVEGDGYMDVVVQHGQDEDGVLTKYPLLLYRNIDNTRFEKVDTGIPAWGRVVVVEDFNGDGLNDLFFADHGEESTPETSERTLGTNQLLIQNGEGSFTETTSGALPSELFYSHGACAGDVNMDGAPDIVVNMLETEQVLINNGNGTFTEQNDFITPMLNAPGESSEEHPIDPQPWACGMGDFRNTGGMDVIFSNDGYEVPSNYGDGYPNNYQAVDPFGNSLPQSAKLLFNNNGTELEYRYPESIIESPWDGSGTAAVGLNTLTHDFNRDGCLDFSVYSTDYVNMHKAEVYLGDCSGGFSEPQVLTLPAIDFLWEDIELADVDGDGWMDIVMSNNLADDWIWGGGNRSDMHVVLENSGGHFTLREGQPSDAASIPPSVAVSWILE